jgi:hypothetical protein
MDLPLYARVLWRFRLLMFVGFLLAVLMAILAMFTIRFDGGKPRLERRGIELWQSQATLVLTQNGFLAGYVPGTSRIDPLSFTSLTSTYGRLAGSDEVLSLIKRSGVPQGGEFSAAAAVDYAGGRAEPLPMLNLYGTGLTPGKAQKLTNVGTRVFIDYIAERQDQAGIPEKRRVLLRVVNSAQPAILIKAPKKTLPIVVFLAVLFAMTALVFVLENLRPSIRVVHAEAEALGRTDVRRSA